MNGTARHIFLVLLFLILPLSSAHADIVTGLVGWWKLDGNGNDSSGKGNNGVVTNALPTTDRFNMSDKAMIFDGDSDSINIGQPASLRMGTSDFSVSLWVKVNNHRNYNSIFSNKNLAGIYNGFALFGTLQGMIVAKLMYAQTIWVNSVIPAGDVSLGTWYMLTYVRAGAMQYLYLNSIVKDSDDTGTVYDIVGSMDTMIGLNNAIACDGSIDDVRIYNRALTQTDITELYNYHTSTTLGNADIRNAVIK